MDTFDLAARGASEGLWDWNLTTNRIHYSRRWISMLGYEENEFGNTPEDWFTKIHPEDVEKARRDIRAQLESNSPQIEMRHRMIHKDGSHRWMSCRGVVTRDGTGQAVRIAGCHSDVTADKVVDTLTGLPNRILLLDRLTRSIEGAKRRSDFLFAVLILDLDLPESLLHRIGSQDGDSLVIAAARRLETCLRAGDTVARLGRDHVVARSGGGEFIILIDGLNEVGEAKTVGERLLKEALAPFELNGVQVFLSASIGIALSATGYRNAEEALRDADTALHRAKSLGKSRCEIFDTAILDSVQARIQLEADLREALKRQEFELAYQPIVSLKSHQIAGFEALARWRHPVRGEVSPSEYVPIAERTGIIIPIGRWVLREACRQLKAWREIRGNPSDLWISVNLSAVQFMTPALARDVRQILMDVDLAANGLILELTESAVMANPEAASSVLMQLRVLGAQIALDDFGTGYSSLAHLRRFPVDFLKIDHSFVREVENRCDALEITRTICELAHQLGLSVIAEGIETSGQLDRVRSLNCEFGQGFFFSRAVSGEVAETLLKDGLAAPDVSKSPSATAGHGNAGTHLLSPPPSASELQVGASIKKWKRILRPGTIYAAAGLTVVVLLFLGGLFARLNHLASPPEAFTSSSNQPETTAGKVVAEKPAVPPQTSRKSVPSSAKAAATPGVIPKTPKKDPPAPVFIYPVVHDHVVGSCKGNLKVTREAISFVSDKGNEGFNLAHSLCSYTLERDRLTIKTGSKTYHFKSAGAVTKEENRSQLEGIVQTISIVQESAGKKQ